MEPNAAWIGKDASSPWELVHSPARRPTAWQRDGHPTDGGGADKGGPNVGLSIRPGTNASGAMRSKGSGSRPLEEATTRTSLYPLRSRLNGLPRAERGSDAGVAGTPQGTQAAKSIETKKNDSTSNASAPSEPKLYNKARAEPSPARHEAHAMYTGVLASSLRLRDLLGKQLPQQRQQQPPYGPGAAQDENTEEIPSQHASENTGALSISAGAAGSQWRGGSSDNGVAARSQLVLLACALVNTPHSAAKGRGLLELPEAAGEAVAQQQQQQQQQVHVSGEEQGGVDDRVDIQGGSMGGPDHMRSGGGAVVARSVGPGASAVEDADLSVEELDSCLATGAATLQVELPSAEAPAAPTSLLVDYLKSGPGTSRRAGSRPTGSPLAAPGLSPFCTPGSRGKCYQQSLLRCSSPMDLFHAIQSAQTRAGSVTARAGGLAAMPTPTHGSVAVCATTQQPPASGTPGSAAIRIELPDPCPVKYLKSSSTLNAANTAGVRTKGAAGVMARATSAAIDSEGEPAAERRMTRSRSRSQLNWGGTHPSTSAQEPPILQCAVPAPKRIEDGSTMGVGAGSVAATAPGTGAAAGAASGGGVTQVPVATGEDAAAIAIADVIAADEAAANASGGGGDGGVPVSGVPGGIKINSSGMENADIVPSACVLDHGGGEEEDGTLQHDVTRRRTSLRAPDVRTQVQDMVEDTARACASGAEHPAALGPLEDSGAAAAAADQPAKQQSAVMKAVPSPTASTLNTDPSATILELAARAVAACDTRDPQAERRDVKLRHEPNVTAAGAATCDGTMTSAHVGGGAASNKAVDSVAGENVAVGPVEAQPAVAADVNAQCGAGGAGGTGAPSPTGDQQQPSAVSAVARAGVGEGKRIKGAAGRVERAWRGKGRGRGRPPLGTAAAGGRIMVNSGKTPKREMTMAAAAAAVTPATKLRAAFPDGASGDDSSPDVPIGVLAAAANALDAGAAMQPVVLGAQRVIAAETPAAAQPKCAAAVVAVTAALVSTPGMVVPELASADPIAEIPDSADLPIGVLAAAAAAAALGIAATRSPGFSPGSRPHQPPPPPLPAANQSGHLAAAVSEVPATALLAASVPSGAAGALTGTRAQNATPGVMARSCEPRSAGAPETRLAGKSRTARHPTLDSKLERRKRKRRSSSSSGALTAPGTAAANAGGAAKGRSTAAPPDIGGDEAGVSSRGTGDADGGGAEGPAGVSQEAGPQDMECEAATSEKDEPGVQPEAVQPSFYAPTSFAALPQPPPSSNAPSEVGGADEYTTEHREVSASITKLAPGGAVEPENEPAVETAGAAAPAPAPLAGAFAPAGRVQLRQLWKRPRHGGAMTAPPVGMSSKMGGSRLGVASRMRQQTPPPPEPQPQPHGSNQKQQQQQQGNGTPGEPNLLLHHTTEQAAAQTVSAQADAREQPAAGATWELGATLVGVQGQGGDGGCKAGTEGASGRAGSSQDADAPLPPLQRAQEAPAKEDQEGSVAAAVRRHRLQHEALAAVSLGDGDGTVEGNGADAAVVGSLSSGPGPGLANAEVEAVHPGQASDREDIPSRVATNRVHIRSMWKRPRLAEAARQAAHGSGRPTGRRALLGPRVVGQPEAAPAAPASVGAASASHPGAGPSPAEGSGSVMLPRADDKGDDAGRTKSKPTAAAVPMASSTAAGGSGFAALLKAPAVADGECEIRLQPRQLESAVGEREVGTKGEESQAATYGGLLGRGKEKAGLPEANTNANANAAGFGPISCGDGKGDAADVNRGRNAEAPGGLMDVDVPTAAGYADVDRKRSCASAAAAAAAANVVVAAIPPAPLAVAAAVMRVALGGGPPGGEVVHQTPPRIVRTNLGSLTPVPAAAGAAAAPSPKGSVGGSIGKPPRSPGGLRGGVAMSLSPRFASSPLPPSRGPAAASAAGGHRLRDPSVHPAAVAGSSGLSPAPPLLSKLHAATVRSPSAALPIPVGDGAWAMSQAAASPINGSTALLAAMAAEGSVVASPAARGKLPMVHMAAVERRAAAVAEVSFLHPLAPIRTKPPHLSPLGNIPPRVKPSVVQAVEALLSIPLLGEDSSPSSCGGVTAAGDDATAATSSRAADGDVVMAEMAPVMTMSATVAEGVDATAPSASCGACRLERLLDAAAETHGSVGRRPTGELHSPLTLLFDVAAAAAQGGAEISSQKQMMSIESSVDSDAVAGVAAAAATAAAGVQGQANGTGSGGGGDPPSERPKIFRSALRDVQPFFSMLGPCAAAPIGARSPSASAAGGPGDPGHNGGSVSSLVCDERLDMLSGKAASPLPPRPRPAGKGPSDMRAGVGLSRLGGGRMSPSKILVSGQADSPVPSLRPPEGYSTPPFRSGKHRMPLHHGISGWHRGGDLYPGHQYDSMIEDVVQQMLNEGSPESPSPLELGRQPVATSGADIVAEAEAVATATAETTVEAEADVGVGREGAVDIATHRVSELVEEDAVNGAAAGMQSPQREEQQQATPPLRRSIYLTSPTGKRRRSGDPEGYDINVAEAAAAAMAAEARASTDPRDESLQAQPPSSGHRRRPRKAPRVDGGASKSAVAAAVAAAAAAAAASTQVSLGELSNLGSEDSDADEDMLDSYSVAATDAGSGGGGPGRGWAGQVKTHGSVHGGPARGPGAVFAGKMFPSSYGAPGGANWMKPGLAWSRTTGTAPPPPGYHNATGPARMSPQLRAGGGAASVAGPYRPSSAIPGHHNPGGGGGGGRFVLAAPSAPSTGPPTGISEQVGDPGDIFLDVPRTLTLQRGSRRQSTYLSSFNESNSARPTLEQEYREAFINAKLAQAWAAGERWARCDLAGLPADITKRGAMERLALLSSAASKLNCYRGTEGAAKITAKVNEEWEHLRRIRMAAASRSSARTPTGFTPSPAPRGLSAGRPPHTPLPFAAHAHAAAAGAAAAGAAAAAASASGAPEPQRMDQREEEEESGDVMATPPPPPPPPPAVPLPSLQLDQGAEIQAAAQEVQQQQQQQQQEQQQHGVHHGLAQLVSAHANCHRGSPPPATASTASQRHPHHHNHHNHHHNHNHHYHHNHNHLNHTGHGYNEQPHSHQHQHQHQQLHHFHNHHNPHPHPPVRTALSHDGRPAASAASQAEHPQQGSCQAQAGGAPPVPLYDTSVNAISSAAAAGGGVEGFGTPVPRVVRGEGEGEGEGGGDRSTATPPLSKSRAVQGDLSAMSLRNLHQQMTPPASILKTVSTPYTARGTAATPGGGGGLTTGGRKAVKFAAILELGPQSGYRHADWPAPPPRLEFDLSQSQLPPALASLPPGQQAAEPQQAQPREAEELEGDQ